MAIEKYENTGGRFWLHSFNDGLYFGSFITLSPAKERQLSVRYNWAHYNSRVSYLTREARRKVIKANLIYNITFIWVYLTSLSNFDKKRRRTSCWRTKSNGTSGKNVKNIIWHSFSTLRAILNHCSIVHHIKLMGYRYFSSTPKGPQLFYKGYH